MKIINLVKFIFLSVVSVLLAILAFQTSYYKESNDLEIVFLDVGQGDCAYIKTPDNYRILIDSGDEGSFDNKIKNFLGERKVNKLNSCVVSHFHEDHFSGLYEMMGKIDIDCIYMSDMCGDISGKNKICEKAKLCGIECVSRKAGDIIYEGEDGVKISVIFPDESIYKNNKEEENDNSLVLLVEYKNKKTLFTGDLELNAQAELACQKNIDADILKVSHHGSKDALSETFLDRVMPEYSVVSCGVNNKFDFPHLFVIESLFRHNSKMFRTDLNGDVRFKIDKNGEITVETVR